MVSAPQPLLYKTVYTETVHHTAEYFAKKIKETIMACGKDRYLAVCVDNVSSMVKALRLQNSGNHRYPHLDNEDLKYLQHVCLIIFKCVLLHSALLISRLPNKTIF